jgi:4'-phosphopantetheinyl transferase
VIEMNTDFSTEPASLAGLERLEPLARGRVDAWFLRLGEAAPDDHEDLRPLVPEEEQSRAKSYRRPEDRQLFLTGRIGLRALLARYAGVEPQDIQIAAIPGQKPRVVAPEVAVPIHFNLSHTDDLVMWVFGLGRAVGVDVEQIARMRVLGEPPEAFFAPAERLLLSALHGRDRDRRLSEHWTMKEAFVKALGTGLRLDVSRIPFDIGPDFTWRCTADGGIDAARWDFRLVRPTPWHTASVCFERMPGDAVALRTKEICLGQRRHKFHV